MQHGQLLGNFSPAVRTHPLRYARTCTPAYTPSTHVYSGIFTTASSTQLSCYACRVEKAVIRCNWVHLHVASPVSHYQRVPASSGGQQTDAKPHSWIGAHSSGQDDVAIATVHAEPAMLTSVGCSWMRTGCTDFTDAIAEQFRIPLH